MKRQSVGINEHENEAVTTYDATKKFYDLRQTDGESIKRFRERFGESWKTAEAAAGLNCLVPGIQRTSQKYKDLSDEEWIEAVKAVSFFIKANKRVFGVKLREVSEAAVLGVDNYPMTLDQAYRILIETQQRMNNGRAMTEKRDTGKNTSATSEPGVSIFQRRTIPDGETIVMRFDRRVYNVQCNNCNAWGHCSRECSSTSSTVSNNKQLTRTHANKKLLKYILDTGSTHTTVKDNSDLINLFKSKILQ